MPIWYKLGLIFIGVVWIFKSFIGRWITIAIYHYKHRRNTQSNQQLR